MKSSDFLENRFLDLFANTFTVIDRYLWAKTYVDILKDPDDSVHSQNADRSTSVYWVCHNEQHKVTARIIQNIEDMQYSSFENFRKINFRFGIAIRTKVFQLNTQIKKLAKKKFDSRCELPGGKRNIGRLKNASKLC